jgi:hypothetical protein
VSEPEDKEHLTERVLAEAIEAYSARIDEINRAHAFDVERLARIYMPGKPEAFTLGFDAADSHWVGKILDARHEYDCQRCTVLPMFHRSIELKPQHDRRRWQALLPHRAGTGTLLLAHMAPHGLKTLIDDHLGEP